MPRNDDLKNRLDELFSPIPSEAALEKVVPFEAPPVVQQTPAGTDIQVTSSFFQTAFECLNDIGHKVDEKPPLNEFLQWIPWRIISGFQQSDKCVVALEYGNAVYGSPEAIQLPSKSVGGLRAAGNVVGWLYVAHIQPRDFVVSESALIGGIVSRVSGYIENQLLVEQFQARVQRERTLREISTHVSSAMDLDTILRIAIRELGNTLGKRTFIRLGNAETLSKVPIEGPDIGNGGKSE